LKDIYVADINDFYKFDLIEKIKSKMGKKILIIWMKTLGDGNRIKYFQELKFKEYNPMLFKELKNIIDNNKRKIEEIQKIKSLKGCKFIDNSLFITNNIKEREKYFLEVSKLLKDIDLVFFDPDNGIAPNNNKKKKNMYLYWDEIKEIWNKNIDLLIYQSIRHEKNFNENIVDCCKKELINANVFPFKTKYALYLLILRNFDKNIINEIIKDWRRINQIGAKI